MTDSTLFDDAVDEADVDMGVDASPGSRAVLQWAAEEARHRDARLQAVHAWHRERARSPLGRPPMGPHVEEQVGRALAAAARGHRPLRPGGGGGDVRCSAVRGRTAEVLIDASARAQQAIVGSRGHGGCPGLLLGSVGQQPAAYAPWPVTVVPVGAIEGAATPSPVRRTSVAGALQWAPDGWVLVVSWFVANDRCASMEEPVLGGEAS